ncbi:MAG: hypothetical protein IH823_09045 [Candidatus Dadabacteria bacterium]|nr:hypothetical protein [Candidatus Dadabacteria bacterium]
MPCSSPRRSSPGSAGSTRQSCWGDDGRPTGVGLDRGLHSRALGGGQRGHGVRLQPGQPGENFPGSDRGGDERKTIHRGNQHRVDQTNNRRQVLSGQGRLRARVGNTGGRARRGGHLTWGFVNPRDFTEDEHRRVDARPYGGGAGMVMMAQPLSDAIRSVAKRGSHIVLLSPQGRRLDEPAVR